MLSFGSSSISFEVNLRLHSNIVPRQSKLFPRYFLSAILFAVTCAAVAQSKSASPPKLAEPPLPVIDKDACPGKSAPIPNVKVVENAVIYSSPDTGKPVGRISAGEKVTVLAGANVIRQPDRAVVRFASHGDSSWPPLEVGDVVLGYGWHVDGNMVFWAKGVRFEATIEAVAEKGKCGFTSGFGPGGCEIDIVKDGKIDWWVQVRTSTGLVGWVLAIKYIDANRWYLWDGNFYDVLQGHCSLD